MTQKNPARSRTSKCRFSTFFFARMCRPAIRAAYAFGCGRALLAAVLALLMPLATAGSISFQLGLTGETLVITNRGDSTAFYPRVFRLASDGQWASLPLETEVADLAPGQSVNASWKINPAEEQAPIAQLKTIMVTYYDQAGAAFGSPTFLGAAVLPSELMAATYEGNELRIKAPAPGAAVSSTWLMWGPGEGIAPLVEAFKPITGPSPTKRIDWQVTAAPEVRIDMGKARPEVMLLSQTPAGFMLQIVQSPRQTGREQRTAWLDQQKLLYAAALAVFAAGCLLLIMQALSRQADKGVQ